LKLISDLRSLLDAFTPGPGEVKSVETVLDLIARDDPVMSADFYTPGHITASAFVLDPGRTRLLLVLHAKLRTWIQPGGHIDPGEDVLGAAIREVEEETGVIGIPVTDGIFDVDVHAIPANGGRPEHTHYDIRFLLIAQDEQLVNTDEVLGARGVALDRLSDLVVDRSVLRAAKKLYPTHDGSFTDC
jgi:8-oxo-dGTP pyrophosphatase MutT (NUDIX family)